MPTQDFFKRPLPGTVRDLDQSVPQFRATIFTRMNRPTIG
jgi:hypothetical protein